MSDLEAKGHAGGRRADIAVADEELLASLGYKQEFKREFTGLEVSENPGWTIKRCFRAGIESSNVLICSRSTDVWHCVQHHWAATVHRVSAFTCGSL